MANNPFFRDETILNESNYLDQLKDRAKRNDPFGVMKGEINKKQNIQEEEDKDETEC